MQKVKSFFKSIFNYIKKTFNDNGDFSLHRSLILLFVMAIWTVLYQMVAQNFNVLQLYGPIMLFNIIPIFLLLLFLYFTIGKISWSFIITNIVLSVLLLINHFKIKFRDEPLNPTDFSLAKEAKNIIQNYDITVDGIVILVVVVCALSFWFVAKRVKNKRPGLLTSLIGIVVTLALSAGAYSLIYQNTRIYNALLADLGIFHETTIVSSKGLVYSLINNTSVMRYDKPDSYSGENTDEILSAYPDNKIPSDAPNVIAIMCEAYTDVQDWGNIEFVDENPYSYMNNLRKKACYGQIYVPGFGGATSSTEFEFLTGCNTSAISPTMPTAYKTLITQDAYSIVQLFKEAGFTTSAMHPGNAWFYNRQNVYPRLGFDSFTSRDDLEAQGVEIPLSTGYYADDTLASDMIISDFQKHIESGEEGGHFSFTITIQNHGPYNEKRLTYGKEYVAKTPELAENEYYIINNYLGGIKAADVLLETIYDYINTIDEPTVLVFFGDHLPYLDDEQTMFKKLGLDIGGESKDAQNLLNMYSTDYLIIGNKAFLRSTKPQLKGEQELISANYLAVKMFKYMDLELPPFFAFCDEMSNFAPLLSRNHNGYPGTLEETLTEEQNEVINKYKLLQYRNIKDYQVERGEDQ